MNGGAAERDAAETALVATAVLAAVAFFALLPWRPYAGSPLLKAMAIAPLALASWRARRRAPGARVLAIALTLHGIGDVLLELDRERLFLAAMAPFFAGHILYAAVFGARRRAPLPRPRQLMIGVLLAFSGGMTALLLSRLTGPLKAAVPIYVAALTAMAALALASRARGAALAAGAVLYVVSDALIGVQQFLVPLGRGELLIWPTYVGAQLLITHGVVRRGFAPA